MVAIAILAGAARGADPPPDPSKLNTPYAITAASDGSLWIADALGVMRMTPTGSYTRVVEAPRVTSIAPGPDGAIWFTEYEPPRIGRIDSAGQVTYFSEGISSWSAGIAAGPDGNVWFTEYGAQRIARITPSGTVTEFSQGLLPDSQPVAIVAGPDGRMWFTDYSGRVGRITTAGKITEFKLPRSQFGGPDQIAVGADGRLWATYDEKVARITTAGHVRLFKSPFSVPGGIVAGPDGNIWLAGYVGFRDVGATVARMRPDGRSRVFSRGFSGDSTDAITAAGGRLWVTESPRQHAHGYRVARLSSTGRATEFPAAPPCTVPSVLRMGIENVRDWMYASLCRLDRSSDRAGRHRGAVALEVKPAAGSELPFNSRVHVRFGPVPPLPKHCRLPFAAEQVASTDDVLVFSYPSFNYHDDAVITHFGACLRPDGAPHKIVAAHDELLLYQKASGFQIAGGFVVYRFEDIDHYNEASVELRVFDVRRGRGVFSRGVESHQGDFGPDEPDNPILGEFALSAHGAIAWVRQEGDVTRLYARGPGTPLRRLDEDAEITGLRFDGDVLSWTAGSTVKSATVR